MIGRAMEKWPDDALRRVVDAPVEAWVEGGLIFQGARCLIGHAGAAAHSTDYYGPQQRLGMKPGSLTRTYLAFDELCDRIGLPRTVRLVKRRALAILLERHPLDSRLAVLQAD